MENHQHDKKLHKIKTYILNISIVNTSKIILKFFSFHNRYLRWLPEGYSRVSRNEWCDIRDTKFDWLRQFWKKCTTKHLGEPATIAKLILFNLPYLHIRTRTSQV